MRVFYVHSQRRATGIFNRCPYTTDISTSVAPLAFHIPYTLAEIRRHENAKKDQSIKITRIAEIMCPKVGVTAISLEGSSKEVERALAAKVGKICLECPLVETNYRATSFKEGESLGVAGNTRSLLGMVGAYIRMVADTMAKNSDR